MTDGKDGDDEGALFRRTVQGTRRLDQDRLGPFRRRIPPVPQQRERDAREVIASLLSDGPETMEVETGEELWFSRPGLSHTTLRKLRRGQYAIEAELDLHGQTVEEAREQVASFLRETSDEGRRCVRIVHGKGLSSLARIPILKNKVNGWLRQKEEVLAFCSARPADGGTGAVYVLLRRS